MGDGHTACLGPGRVVHGLVQIRRGDTAWCIVRQRPLAIRERGERLSVERRRRVAGRVRGILPVHARVQRRHCVWLLLERRGPGRGALPEVAQIRRPLQRLQATGAVRVWLERRERRLRDLQRRGRGVEVGGAGVVHARIEEGDACTGAVLAQVVEHMRELHSRADQVVAQDVGRLRALCPVRALLPRLHRGPCAVARADAQRDARGPGRDDVLEVELRRLREHEGREALARGQAAELGLRDDVEGDLHFESVSGGMDEPRQAAFGLANVCDEVVFARGDSTPGAYRQVGAWDDRNRCENIKLALGTHAAHTEGTDVGPRG